MTTARTLLFTVAVAGFALTSPARAQSALFSGRVVDEASSRPIAGAIVQLPQLERLLHTDSTGRFSTGPVESGPIVVVVRALGYTPVTTSFKLAARGSLDAQFQLRASVTTLTAVRAESRRPPGMPRMYDARLRDFEARRELGSGRFLDWELFERNKLRDVPEILRQHIAGIYMMGNKTLSSSRSGCPVRIIINDVRVRLPFDLRTVRAADVIGFEYYNASNTPARFNTTGDSSCGTAVFWTKY